MSSLDMSPASKKEVDSFTKKLTREAELLVSTFFPQKIADMDNLLQKKEKEGKKSDDKEEDE
ncbi:proteasome activator complex subunit 1, partial [Silurus asotus]